MNNSVLAPLVSNALSKTNLANFSTNSLNSTNLINKINLTDASNFLNLLNLTNSASFNNLTNSISLRNSTASYVTPSFKNESIDAILPKKGSAEEEHNFSMAIFFVLSVIAACIIVIHLILKLKINYIPESLAVVLTGTFIGLCIKLSSSKNFGDWQKEEMFNPTAFFLVLLPPIMYESGYNLHKGNFFQNIGSILIFACFGTTISALVIGGGVYLLGLADLVYKLTFAESFLFGALISALDPIAKDHALDFDPVLSMLVFGESILNDAVSIVLATTALETSQHGSISLLDGILRFLIVFFGSAAIGVASALFAAILFKYVDLRKNPSLEFGMMLVFIYAPYGLAEGVHLSGIQAIVFNGIVMSHYVHYNLSPITQVVMQATLKTLAFTAETCVFAYLGLALFSFPLSIEPSFIIWSIILCFVGRAANIYPLSYLCNIFREHKISKKMMFFMFFSGLRGAVAYALALHLEISQEKKHVIVTTTLIIVLFTIILLGSSSLPVMKFMKTENHIKKDGKNKNKKNSFSKTKETEQSLDHFFELKEESNDQNFIQNNVSGFVKFDLRYLMPFFTRKFTEQEVQDCKSQMTKLTNKWYFSVKKPQTLDIEVDNSHQYLEYKDYSEYRTYA